MPAPCPCFRWPLPLSSLLLLIVLSMAGAQAQEQAPRPKIGLVLSGGGARGVAHVGVLKVLQELRVPVDVVVGTSMGSIVGGAYAAGMSPEEMEKRIRDAKWDVVLADRPPRAQRSMRSKELERRNVFGFELGYRDGQFRLPKGALFGQQLELFLNTLTAGALNRSRFDALQIPYRAVATDIETGKMVVLDHSDLTRAMRASMSVPGVFAPVEIDGRLLVDGGLVRNLPVDVARSLGADIVIAVNLGTPLLKREDIASVLSISTQMLNILTEQNVAASLAQLTHRDILISPELGKFSSGDFFNAVDTIEVGENAARAQALALAQLGLDEARYAQYLRQRVAQTPAEKPVDAVRVDPRGLRRVNPDTVAATVRVPPGKPVDSARLQADLRTLYGSDDFQQIRYRFEEENGKRALVLEPIEKEWGPNYLQFGLNLSTDLRGDSSFELMMDHRMTWLNRWGLEWRNDISIGRTTSWHSELQQPLNAARTLFVAPYIDLRQVRDNIFLEDDPVVTYKLVRMVGGVDVGLRPTAATTLRVGYSAGRVEETPAIALPGFPSGKDSVAELRVKATYDAFDDWLFPSAGMYAHALGVLSRRGIGADEDYQTVQGEIDKAFSHGSHRFVVGLKGGSSLGSDLSLSNVFSLGGFLNLSGLQNRQLLGNRYALGRAVYYRRFGDASLVSMPLYVGASLEAGNVYGRLNGTQTDGLILGGSLFAAIDTTLGPFYLALGLAEGGHYAFYLFLGRP